MLPAVCLARENPRFSSSRVLRRRQAVRGPPRFRSHERSSPHEAQTIAALRRRCPPVRRHGARADDADGRSDGQGRRSGGVALPGVAVSVTTTALQGRRSASTSANGDYILPSPPGADRSLGDAGSPAALRRASSTAASSAESGAKDTDAGYSLRMSSMKASRRSRRSVTIGRLQTPPKGVRKRRRAAPAVIEALSASVRWRTGGHQNGNDPV